MRTIFLFLMMATCLTELYAQDNWELATNEDGIKVYVGEVTNSDYYAFKAVMLVKTTETEIVKILKDVIKYPEWFAYSASTKLISQSVNEQFFFMETDYPWPYSNECMNYKMVFEKVNATKMTISIVGTNRNMDCDYILNKASGYILLESESGNIKITYYFHSEPSQSIPTWLINPMIYKMPLETFKALKTKLNP